MKKLLVASVLLGLACLVSGYFLLTPQSVQAQTPVQSCPAAAPGTEITVTFAWKDPNNNPISVQFTIPQNASTVFNWYAARYCFKYNKMDDGTDLPQQYWTSRFFETEVRDKLVKPVMDECLANPTCAATQTSVKTALDSVKSAQDQAEAAKQQVIKNAITPKIP